MVGLAITRYEMESNGGLITTCNPFYQQDKGAQQARYIRTLCRCTYDFRWINVRNWYDFNLKLGAGGSKNGSKGGSGTFFSWMNPLFEHIHFRGNKMECTNQAPSSVWMENSGWALGDPILQSSGQQSLHKACLHCWVWLSMGTRKALNWKDPGMILLISW